MTTVLIALLLASNLFMVGLVFRSPSSSKEENGKPSDQPASGNNPKEAEAKSEKETLDSENPPAVADVLGKSSLDLDALRGTVIEAVKSSLTDTVKEIVPLIIKEYGTLADAGLEEPASGNENMAVPREKLDEVFSHHTISEITGETPDVAEPRADGLDFESMNTTVKVLKDEPHTAEDEVTAARTLPALEGTEIIEKIKLDPVIRKRILQIQCQLPEVEEKTDEGKPRKIVFHADIDTTDIDSIDFNIFK